MTHREILFDIDGVILDFVSAFCKICRANGYALRYDEITEYHMGRLLGVSREEFQRLLDATYDSRLVEPYPGAVEGLRRVRAEGGVIKLVTGRPHSVRDVTLATLRHAGVSYDDLVFSPPGRKAEHAQKVTVAVVRILGREVVRESPGIRAGP